MTMAGPESSSSESTMEALSDFLQKMNRTIEGLYGGHILARQTLKHGNSDSCQNCYDFGMLPSTSKGFHQPQQSVVPDGVGTTGQMQSWFFQQPSSPLQEASPRSKLIGKTNLRACSSEVDIGNALSGFLADMKKTIEMWSSRYHLLAEGKTEGLDVEASPSVHVIDQLDFVPDADKDLSVMEDLDLPHAETLNRTAQTGNGILQRSPADNQGRKGRKTHFQGQQSTADANFLSMQGFNEVMGNQVQESQPQGLQECTEGDGQAQHGHMDMEQPGCNNNENMGSEHDSQTAIVLRTENAGAKSGQRKRKPRKKAGATSINSQELTIRRFQYKVEVVESPDWLPKGWITELKTRSTGGSAGSKDKYYFDPVSNRRCRSQKEVFSLIETGKLGRYKRKTKALPVKSSSGGETSPLLKSGDLNESRSSNRHDAMVEGSGAASRSSNRHDATVEGSGAVPHQQAHESTAGSVPGPFPAITPSGGGQMGVGVNAFLPCRPGQPSDWLVYDSMAPTIPRPVLENFRFADPYPVKSISERGSAPWPWSLNNSESSMKSYVDRFEMSKAALMAGREDMLGIGQFTSREPRFSDIAAKRARKPSKRAAVS